MSYLFTSEAVTKGHPDKMCDQIADAILTACLSRDKDSRVACEVCATTNTVILMGEITTNAELDYEEIARDVIHRIGYIDEEIGINYSTCEVINLIDKQSSEINSAVFKYFIETQGAGDQGIMFGYACNETEELMPLSTMLSHKLARRLEKVREEEPLMLLRPDGKTQVTVSYKKGVLDSIHTILISTQHVPEFTGEMLNEYIMENVIIPVIKELNYEHLIKGTNFIINPSGSFTVGGPHGDSGLTGRKLAVDTYGGHAKFGGGAICGKDPSKVDRSGAYMARYIAKHLVASGMCSQAEVQLSYGIGIAEPISINVEVKNCNYPKTMLVEIIKKVFDTRPGCIIEKLKLKSFNYNLLSGDCQFGNNFAPWEILDEDIVNTIREYRYAYMRSYIE